MTLILKFNKLLQEDNYNEYSFIRCMLLDCSNYNIKLSAVSTNTIYKIFVSIFE